MRNKRLKQEEITFRTLKNDELDQIAEVFSKAFKFKVNSEEYKKRFKGRDAPDFKSQAVAVHHGKVIAGIRADRKPLYFRDKSTGKQALHECGEINDVCTHPDYRKRGIARKLLKMSIQYIEEKKWEMAALQADPKYHAHKLYDSEGFHVLTSTGDIWHVGFGNTTTRWRYFNILGLFLPAVAKLIKRFIPRPPAKCMNVIKPVKKKKKKEYNHNHPFKDENLKAIHISGTIHDGDPWTIPWKENVNGTIQSIQGIPETFLQEVLLEKPSNKTLPDKVLKSMKKNKSFQKFISAGGKVNNFILLAKNKTGEKTMKTLIDSKQEFHDELVGGARYTIQHVQRGRINVILAFIDVIWIKEGSRKKGYGTDFLEYIKGFLGKSFPIIVCRSSSGNIPLRKTLQHAGYLPIGGGITQVRNFHNKKLYDELSMAIEPWFLT
ncbi:MAG: GNAT family N-acetyltransferase [Promethearchaeota archaeon]